MALGILVGLVVIALAIDPDVLEKLWAAVWVAAVWCSWNDIRKKE